MEKQVQLTSLPTLVKATTIMLVTCFCTLFATENDASLPAKDESLNALFTKDMLTDPEFNKAFQPKDTPDFTGELAHDRQIIKTKSCQRFNFYNDYLAKYYPKAFVIRINFFLTMSPADIEKALKDIVVLLTTQPWFYFANKKNEIQITHYWEYIIDQLRILNDFLVNALVKNGTETVYLPKDYNVQKVLESDLFFADSMGGMNEGKENEGTPLIEKLLTCGTSVHEFYALCFDYLIKLFNEKILTNEFAEASIYFYDLEELVSKLQGSIYEIPYQENVKTAKELINLLKSRREAQKTKSRAATIDAP